jgi:hypothetical protein
LDRITTLVVSEDAAVAFELESAETYAHRQTRGRRKANITGIGDASVAQTSCRYPDASSASA